MDIYFDQFLQKMKLVGWLSKAVYRPQQQESVGDIMPVVSYDMTLCTALEQRDLHIIEELETV